MKHPFLLLFLIPPLFAQSPVPKREANLKVFRTVLDGNPRVLVIRMGDEHALAFDVEKGCLWKAWKAEAGKMPVNLQGAVYDGAHGPQPTADGKALFIDEKPQLVCSDATARLEYLGHSPTSDGSAIVRWAFPKADRNVAVIAVKPSFSDGKILVDYKLEGDPSPGVEVAARAPGTSDPAKALGASPLSVTFKL
jgi:hypothetical protein